MNKKELSQKNPNILTTLYCATTERNIEIWFCESDFLDKITYNPDFEYVFEYVIQHLNDHYWSCCYIEGEEFCDILQPINEELEREAKLRIESSKFNLFT